MSGTKGRTILSTGLRSAGTDRRQEESTRQIIEYIRNNKEWIFSGVGVLVLSAIVWACRRLFSLVRRGTGAGIGGSTGKIEVRAQDRLGHRFEFSDGVVAYARLRYSSTIEDALLFFKAFKTHRDCANALGPLVHARACYLLEPYTYAEAKLHRREVELKLTEDLQETYAKHGMKLDGITIGSLRV